MQHLVKIGVISNFTLEPFFCPLLKKRFNDEKKIIVESTFVWYEEICAWDMSKYKTMDVEMVVLWLNYEVLTDEIILALHDNMMQREEAIELILLQYNNIINNFIERDIDIICISFDKANIYPTIYLGNVFDKTDILVELNYLLWLQLKNKATFIDIVNCMVKADKAQIYDFVNKYRWGSMYCKELYEIVAQEVYKHYLAINRDTKKCIVVDCDNVLWGGILSEDGIEKIKLGKIGQGGIYRDFQKVLLDMYYHGVIIAVCSKNDISDVLKMFREHDEMILHEKHISCFQINWENKVDNILKISNFLNIGLDSMIFIDDSEFEIESVRHFLPEVQCIHFSRHVEKVYKGLISFSLQTEIEKEKVEKRNKTYQTNGLREKLKESYSDYNEYLEALEMQCVISIATNTVYSRVAELSLRTNKCTNGVRYKVNVLAEKVRKANYVLYAVYLRDRFSDLGLVGAVGIENDTSLDLFCLSCRALGRNIESKMMYHVKEHHKISSVRFEKTGKNEEIENMLLKWC